MRLFCRLGRHEWQTMTNPDVGGIQVVYQQCRRCGKERPVYGKPPATGVGAG